MLPNVEKRNFSVLEGTEVLTGIAPPVYSALKNLTSVATLKKFQEIVNIQAIAFVGSSASGKSTLMKQIRLKSSDLKDITIPNRYITRGIRLDDDFEENRHVSTKQFEELVEKGEVGLHWQRKMEGDRIERYGFEKTAPEKIALYAANNDFFRAIEKRESQQIKDLSKILLIIGVYAPDEIRKQRLRERSPDIGELEVNYRNGDSSDNIIPHCHLLINNYGKTKNRALHDIVEIVQIILKNCVKWGEIKDLGNHRSIYSSRLFDIINHEVLFSDGTIKTFEYVERSPGVRTLITDGNSILVTKEWRQEASMWDIRLPGGKVFENIKDYKIFKQQNPEKDFLIEEAKKAAQKETSEEVGLNLDIQGFELAHISKCGAVIEWDLYYFSMTVENAFSSQKQMITEENETILNCWLSFEETKKLCLSGQVSEDRTSNFLLKYINNKQK